MITVKRHSVFSSTIHVIKKHGFLRSWVKFFKKCLDVGFINTLLLVKNILFLKHQHQYIAPLTAQTKSFSAITQLDGINNLLKTIYQLIDLNFVRGIIFIDSAFDFDAQRNQRTIAFAKSFASMGYFIVFLRYQWSKQDTSSKDYQIFNERVGQVPRFDLECLMNTYLPNLSNIDNYFIVTIPDNFLLQNILLLRKIGIKIIYDILDNWEEFHKVGCAPWYKKHIEEYFINNADTVSAVSKPLVDKFINHRDIVLVKNTAFKGTKPLPLPDISDTYHVGYFGHLNEKWFNWDYIFKLAEDKNFMIHLIGEGISDNAALLKKIEQYENIQFYGYIPQKSLGEIVKKFSVGLIPFIENQLSNCVDPLKIYEYLQFGRPVIVTGIPHIASDYPYCVYVNTFDEFKLNIIKFIKEIKIRQSIVDRWMENNYWIDKCNMLLESNLKIGND